MENQSEFHKYIAWKTPEEMHYSSLQWISYLDFIRDEHRFFEEILREYTLPVIEAHQLDRVRELANNLSVSEREEKEITGKLISHKNRLKIMIDEKDELKKEQDYTTEHGNLKMEVSRYTEKFRVLKREIFAIISSVMKKQKDNRLLR